MKNKAHDTVDLQGAARRAYAAPGDFCAIFGEEMDALYSLALLLTADHEMAEACFLAALDDCRNTSGVFWEWARSWSKRAVIKQAIQQVHPVPDAAGATEVAHESEEIEDIPRRLLQLRPFERFVFGMSVLEQYSDRECATLLDCHPRDVGRARTRTLQFLGRSDRLTALAAAGSRKEPLVSATVEQGLRLSL